MKARLGAMVIGLVDITERPLENLSRLSKVYCVPATQFPDVLDTFTSHPEMVEGGEKASVAFAHVVRQS